MANLALQNQKERLVEVNREKLLATLKENRNKHIADYNEAMAGYKDNLLTKMKEAFEDAKVKLEKDFKDKCSKVSSFNDDDIKKQPDRIVLVEQNTITMKVPHSYQKEYDAAISMAEWDVRETIVLTQPEFVCFVQDEWDWKEEFNTISTMYKSFK